MQDLTAAIFAADMDGTVNGFRRHLQSDYVTRLGAMATGAAEIVLRQFGAGDGFV